MEKSVQIIQQGALVERPYQDRNGQQQVFASRPFAPAPRADADEHPRVQGQGWQYPIQQ